MTNTTGYLLAPLHITKSALQSNDAYRVEFFPSLPGETWFVGLPETDSLRPYAQRRTLLSGRETTQGYASFTWNLVLSQTQLAYIVTLAASNRLDGLVTAQTYDIFEGAWYCYIATLHLIREGVPSTNNTWFPLSSLQFTQATRIE